MRSPKYRATPTRAGIQQRRCDPLAVLAVDVSDPVRVPDRLAGARLVVLAKQRELSDALAGDAVDVVRLPDPLHVARAFVAEAERLVDDRLAPTLAGDPVDVEGLPDRLARPVVATADAVQVDAFAEEEAAEIARGARGDVAAMEG